MARLGLLIGELAKLAGVTPRTIRHYEQLGLLDETTRGANGYRRYGPSALLALAEIRHLRALGLSLAEIADARRRDHATEALPARLQRLDETLGRRIEALETQRAAVRELDRGLVSGDSILAARRTPSSFDRVTELLERSGASARAVDEERRVWTALESIDLPQAWRDLIEAGLATLVSQPDALLAWRNALEIIAELRDVDAGDVRVDGAVAQLLDIVANVPSATPMVELGDPVTAQIITAVASCFSPAQLEAGARVMAAADGDLFGRAVTADDREQAAT